MIAPIMPTYGRSPIAFERGEGPYLFTPEGERYLDFGGGVAVNVVGHANPHLISALTEQAGKLWHTSNLYQIPNQTRLAERLVAETFADTVFFCNSGAEAMECAIKTARRFHWANGNPERYRLVTFEGAFHGRTLATIAAGAQAKHLEGFGPPVDGFDQVPFGDLDALKEIIGPETAGVILEPLQGEGGIRQFAPEFLRHVREICDEEGILLVLDEVQTGIGRTGKLFAHEWSGITPDIMGIAKALGGGFPIGACLTTERVGSAMTAGSHGSTFGGNPLASAVANAVLDIVLAPSFLDDVNRVGKFLIQELGAVVEAHPRVVKGIRGEGLMIGIEAGVPAAELIKALAENHLLSVAAGDNVVRFLPPLIIDESHAREALETLDAACQDIESALDAGALEEAVL